VFGLGVMRQAPLRRLSTSVRALVPCAFMAYPVATHTDEELHHAERSCFRARGVFGLAVSRQVPRPVSSPVSCGK
jgi:hypothetical protein